MIETIVNVALGIMVILTLLAGIRALRGPAIADRLLAIDLITTFLIGIIVLITLIDEQAALIDLAIGLAALSFIATMSIARYISDGKVF